MKSQLSYHFGGGGDLSRIAPKNHTTFILQIMSLIGCCKTPKPDVTLGKKASFVRHLSLSYYCLFLSNFYNQQLAQGSPQDSRIFLVFRRLRPTLTSVNFPHLKFKQKSGSLNQRDAFCTTGLTTCNIHVRRYYAEILISFKSQNGLFLGSTLSWAVSFLTSPKILQNLKL